MGAATSVASAALAYAFPNDLHVHWNLTIVLYPYITGIVAGNAPLDANMLVYVFRQRLGQLHAETMQIKVIFVAVGREPLTGDVAHARAGCDDGKSSHIRLAG